MVLIRQEEPMYGPFGLMFLDLWYLLRMRSGPISCTFSCHCMLRHKISTVALRNVHIHFTTSWSLTFYLDHYSCYAYLAFYSELMSYCLNYMGWCVMLPEDQKMWTLNSQVVWIYVYTLQGGKTPLDLSLCFGRDFNSYDLAKLLKLVPANRGVWGSVLTKVRDKDQMLES